MKFAEIAILILCEINDNAPGFCLALSEAYSLSCEAPNMRCFNG